MIGNFFQISKLAMALTAIMLISSCSEHRPAPIRDAGYYKNHKNNKHRNGSKYSRQQRKYRPKYVVVNKGDTLYSIGFKHQIDYKDLAATNNIAKPYRIYPGQKIYLKKPSSQVKTQKLKKQPSLASKKVKTQKTVPTQKPATSSKPTKKVVAQTAQTNKPISQPKVSSTNKPASQPTAKPVVKKPASIKPKPPVKKKTFQAPSSNQRWIWPVHGRLLRTFSSKDVSRKGIEISTPVNTSVASTNNGVVVYSGNGLLGYGELIIIKHSDTLLSAYAHNSKRLVKEGDTVSQGETIAKSGQDPEGKALLHFEIRKNGQPVNPLNYLPKK